MNKKQQNSSGITIEGPPLKAKLLAPAEAGRQAILTEMEMGWQFFTQLLNQEGIPIESVKEQPNGEKAVEYLATLKRISEDSGAGYRIRGLDLLAGVGPLDSPFILKNTKETFVALVDNLERHIETHSNDPKAIGRLILTASEGLSVRRECTLERSCADAVQRLDGIFNNKKELLKGKQVVVRLTSTAVVHAAFNGDSPAYTLYFHRDRLIPSNFPNQGSMAGYRLIIAARLARAIIHEPGKLADSLKTAVASCHLFFKQGWPETLTLKAIDKDYWDKKDGKKTNVETESKKVLSISIPPDDAMSEDVEWSILKQVIRETVNANIENGANNMSGEWLSAGPGRIKAVTGKSLKWSAITYLVRALGLLYRSEFDWKKPKAGEGNTYLGDLPIARIGKLLLLDREEMEDVMGLQSLLVHYAMGSSGRSKPLNLGVFGAPGSGKSFSVKELVNEMKSKKLDFADDAISCNVSQLADRKGLVDVLHRVRNQGIKGKIPLVFFDEFDAALNGRPFGWLGHFLAPMQDGEFEDEGKTYNLPKCVMVFAGGVSRSHAEMAGRLRNAEFCEAKGPDFLSRLQGTLNIRGINRPESEADEGRYLMRRALRIADVLHTRRLKDRGKWPLRKDTGMEASLAWAFLKIEGFKHGVRSLETILDSSKPQPGRPLCVGDLPPVEQLEIHLDSAKFMFLVREAQREKDKLQQHCEVGRCNSVPDS
jgi:hypothetical protein